MVIFSDELNHASLISGIRGSGCEKKVFRNNDVDHLHDLMKQYPKEVPKLVVFESVYSMEGECTLLIHVRSLRCSSKFLSTQETLDH